MIIWFHIDPGQLVWFLFLIMDFVSLNAQLDGVVMLPDELDPNRLQFGSRISPNYTEWVGSVSEH